MTGQAVLTALRAAGVHLELRGAKLRFLAVGSPLTAELRQLVHSNRAELVAALRDDVPTTLRTAIIEGFDDEGWGPLLTDTIALSEVFPVSRDDTARPQRGCYMCRGAQYVRVAGASLWGCPRCHPPQGRVVDEHETRVPAQPWGFTR